MALIALAIVLDSPGGVVFRHKRIGRGGLPFVMYKFRSLAADAPPFSARVGVDDPLVTRVGRLLRPAGLDELPQLVNVLKGEMSLIGPRPEQPFMVDRYELWMWRRFLVPAGMTGWCRVHYRPGWDIETALRYDLDYVDRLGPGIDLEIVFRTLRVVGTGLVAGVRTSIARR
jgi:lipopolysaccharide/colanic/teichoic acid biosynthesis glycosyltransferase